MDARTVILKVKKKFLLWPKISIFPMVLLFIFANKRTPSEAKSQKYALRLKHDVNWFMVQG